MSDATVILTRCEEYDNTKIAKELQRHFELLGGLEKFIKRGDNVLLKPNFIAPRSAHHATQTHPAVIIETVKLLKDFGAKPFVADSPAWSNVENCIKKLKLQEPLKKLNVPYKQLKRAKKCKIGDNIVGVSSLALEADVIINLPKFKSHQQLVATFAVKNMFGTVCGKRKAIWHFRKGKEAEKFCHFLIDIFKYLNPALTIIDAVHVMDGGGPIRGRSRPLGYLISGTEPIALETVCAKLINLKPDDVPIIKTAKSIGFGCSDFEKIEILGDGLPEKPCTDFELPKLIPIRFSFIHVCKSIAKQIVLLAKSAVKINRKRKLNRTRH